MEMSVALESDDRDSDSDSDRDSSSDSDSPSDTESSGDSNSSGDSDSFSDSDSSGESSSDSGSSSDSSLRSPTSKQHVAGLSSSEDDDGDDDCDSESGDMSDSGDEDNPRAERSAAARRESSQAGVEMDTDRPDDGHVETSLDKVVPREDRRQARIGDAVLEMLLAEILRKRFDLAVEPRALTMALVQNTVLSVLAQHYGLYRYGAAGQHHHADRFEAAVAILYDDPYQRPLLVKWLAGVFSLAVFPNVALQIKRFRATLSVILQ
ncbi:uncharacterized protein JCM10292_000002 [Rhodotorula paludigena]|uniref:uncharacterized protein n=1 Tax=Rhodotorula paludigena TaxID=86838 RepID=UPI003174F3F2